MTPRIGIPVPTRFDHVYNEQNWPAYSEAVRASGGEPVRLGLELSAWAAREVAVGCDGFLLPGSPADVAPERYGQRRENFTADADGAREAMDVMLLEMALTEGKPLLAVCFGMQMMNVWSGGTLVQDLAPMPVNHAAGRGVAVAHFAEVAAVCRLATLVDAAEVSGAGGGDRLPVNSSHHQAVGIVGKGFRVVARSIGDGVVEAIEPAAGRSFMVGVQWHPERTFPASATSRALFAELVRSALSHAEISQLSGSATEASS